MSGPELSHPGVHLLRRIRLGELPKEEAQLAQAHLLGCARCRGRLSGLDEEQRAFEERFSFERFEAGVKRAQRGRTQASFGGRWVYPAMAAAAMVLLALTAGPLVRLLEEPSDPSRRQNRLKGGAGVELRIAAGEDGPQRSARAEGAEPLLPGELVRIGYRPGARAFVLALSVDAHGEVSRLYPEEGHSLPAHLGEGVEYLPQSLAFHGSGLERVIVVLSDAPIAVERAEEAARQALEEASGELSKMGPLDLPGEQFHRTLLKP